MLLLVYLCVPLSGCTYGDFMAGDFDGPLSVLDGLFDSRDKAHNREATGGGALTQCTAHSM